MIGRLLIDEIDIYATYGLHVAEQGFNDLISWPPMKEVDVVDWHERDGVEPDLSEPMLGSRRIELPLCGTTTRATAETLIAKLKSAGYHRISSALLGREYNVRLLSAEPIIEQAGIVYVYIHLCEDMPGDYPIEAPKGNMERIEDFGTDGALFTDYNVRILEGSLESITRTPDTKTNLARDLAHHQGIIYDTSIVVSEAYEAELRCLMTAPALDTLWHNYYSLLGHISAPGSHSIDVFANGMAYPCYYVSNRVERFFAEGKIWLEFTLRVNVYGSPIKFKG